jgi:hypothetical protein
MAKCGDKKGRRGRRDLSTQDDSVRFESSTGTSPGVAGAGKRGCGVTGKWLVSRVGRGADVKEVINMGDVSSMIPVVIGEILSLKKCINI